MPETAPDIRISPDGHAVAIRTVFEDDTPGAVSSYVSVDHRGIATYLTTEQVADWKRPAE